MFYRLVQANSFIFWASSKADVDRYIDWVNRNKEFNLAYAEEIGEEGFEDDCAFSMDEPHWDDFMSDEAE